MFDILKHASWQQSEPFDQENQLIFLKKVFYILMKIHKAFNSVGDKIQSDKDYNSEQPLQF